MKTDKIIQLCAFVFFASIFSACSPTVRSSPPSSVPDCGPRIARQTIGFNSTGTDPLPPILDVTWTIRTYCRDTSASGPYTHDTYLEVFQAPNGDFVQRPADGFFALGMGELLEHIERRETVSVTLGNAAQSHWCIEGVARFAGASQQVRFGPVTARQLASSSSFALLFTASRDSTGNIAVSPTFSFMDGCVR